MAQAPPTSSGVSWDVAVPRTAGVHTKAEGLQCNADHCPLGPRSPHLHKALSQHTTGPMTWWLPLVQMSQDVCQGAGTDLWVSVWWCHTQRQSRSAPRAVLLGSRDSPELRVKSPPQCPRTVDAAATSKPKGKRARPSDAEHLQPHHGRPPPGRWSTVGSQHAAAGGTGFCRSLQNRQGGAAAWTWQRWPQPRAVSAASSPQDSQRSYFPHPRDQHGGGVCDKYMQLFPLMSLTSQVGSEPHGTAHQRVPHRCTCRALSG